MYYLLQSLSCRKKIINKFYCIIFLFFLFSSSLKAIGDIPHPDQRQWKTYHNDWREWGRWMCGLSLSVAGMCLVIANGFEKGFTFKNMRNGLALLTGGLLILKKSDFIKYRQDKYPDFPVSVCCLGLSSSFVGIMGIMGAIGVNYFKLTPEAYKFFKNLLIFSSPFFVWCWHYLGRKVVENGENFERVYVFPDIDKEKFLLVERHLKSYILNEIGKKENSYCKKLPVELIERIIRFYKCHDNDPWRILFKDNIPDSIACNLEIFKNCFENLECFQDLINKIIIEKQRQNDSDDQIKISEKIKNNLQEALEKTLRYQLYDKKMRNFYNCLNNFLRDDLEQTKISLEKLKKINMKINKHKKYYTPIELLRSCWINEIPVSEAKRAKENADDLKSRHTMVGLRLLYWLGKKCPSRFMDPVELRLYNVRKLYNMRLNEKYKKKRPLFLPTVSYKEKKSKSIPVTLNEEIQYFYPYERYEKTSDSCFKCDDYVGETLAKRLTEKVYYSRVSDLI